MPAADRNPSTTHDCLDEAVEIARAGARPLLLAVSGGRDSMVMLELLVRAVPERIRAVATFDHGTGAHATEAVRLVRARTRELGLELVSARAGTPLSSESAMRTARWAFLRAQGDRFDAQVATGHTLDDQLETVVMRILRDAGARGLAGLFAESTVRRPMLPCRRVDLELWAQQEQVQWVEDPSNRSRRFLRNRVRLDLLPALLAVRPSLEDELLTLSRRAAALRLEVDAFIARHIPCRFAVGTLIVAREALLRYDAQELGLLWPSLAAKAGVTLDRRGTVRLASFTIEGRSGRRIQLSGGVEVIRHRDELRLRRTASGTTGAEHALVDGMRFGDWQFRVATPDDGALAVTLPARARLTVRAWRPGDRMIPAGATAPRRLKGLFRDAGVDATQRHGWPVVLANEEIVWVPGVRRSSAAAARSGRPVVRFVSERLRS